MNTYFNGNNALQLSIPVEVTVDTQITTTINTTINIEQRLFDLKITDSNNKFNSKDLEIVKENILTEEDWNIYIALYNKYRRAYNPSYIFAQFLKQKGVA